MRVLVVVRSDRERNAEFLRADGYRAVALNLFVRFGITVQIHPGWFEENAAVPIALGSAQIRLRIPQGPMNCLVDVFAFPGFRIPPINTRTSQVHSPLGIICPALPAIAFTFHEFWRTTGTQSTVVRPSFVEVSRVWRLIARQSISAEFEQRVMPPEASAARPAECAQIEPIFSARSCAIFPRGRPEWCDGDTGPTGPRRFQSISSTTEIYVSLSL